MVEIADQPRAITIVVPGTPPSELLPNAARRTHYLAKADISRSLRELAGWQARRQVGADLPLRGWLFDGPVRIRVRVFWEKGRRQPDVSGIGLAVKAFEDGLTDAGVWRDDAQVVEACYGQDRDPEGKGYTVFEIEAIGEAGE